MGFDRIAEPARVKRAFVTGGSGFLGKRLIAELVERVVSVRALARSEAAAIAVRGVGAEPVTSRTSSRVRCSRPTTDSRARSIFSPMASRSISATS